MPCVQRNDGCACFRALLSWALLSCVVLCCAVLCCAVLCCAVLCCAVLCFQIEWLGSLLLHVNHSLTSVAPMLTTTIVLLISDAGQTLFVPQVYWAQRTGKLVVTPDW